MKKKNKIISLFLLMLLMNALKAVPVLNNEPDKVILKNIPSNQISSFTVKLRNTGDSLLRIEKIRVSCKCLNTEINKKEIKPQQEGALKIIIDTEGVHGEKEYSVFIESNDIESPLKKIPVYISVAADSGPFIQIFPETVVMDIAEGQPDKRKGRLLIKNTGTMVLKALLKAENNALIIPEKEIVLQPGGKKMMEFSADMNIIGKSSTSGIKINISSNAANKKEIAVNCFLE